VHKLKSRLGTSRVAVFSGSDGCFGKAVLAGVMTLAAISCAEPAAARKAKDDDASQISGRRTSGPLVAVVSIRNQRVSIYDGTAKIASAPVSTGQPGRDTPKGVFSIIQKEVDHRSNLYDDAEMPYMERITWSGVALHAGNLPGYAASHGCIRMPYDFAQKLYGMTKIGTRVIISRADTGPVEISHPNLFMPKPAKPAAPVAVSQVNSSAVGGAPMRLGARPELVSSGPEAGVASEAEKNAVAVSAAEAVRKAEALRRSTQAKADEATKAADSARKLAATKSADAAKASRMARGADSLKQQAMSRIEMATRAIETATTPEARQRAEEAKAGLEAKFATALQGGEALIAEAEAKRAEAVVAVAEAKTAEAARTAAVAAAREAARRLEPVTVFISRKTGRMYVRQGFEPVFDVPVTIRDTERPIGTHVYTATGLSEDGARMRWTATSATGPEPAPEPRKGKGRRGQEDEAPVSRSAAAAHAVLDRIEMPDESVAKIAAVLSAGSSLIISDHGISHETGRGTDFVILTR